MALALQPSTTTLSPRPPTAHRSPQRAEPTLMGLTHRQMAAAADVEGRRSWTSAAVVVSQRRASRATSLRGRAGLRTGYLPRRGSRWRSRSRKWRRGGLALPPTPGPAFVLPWYRERSGRARDIRVAPCLFDTRASVSCATPTARSALRVASGCLLPPACGGGSTQLRPEGSLRGTQGLLRLVRRTSDADAVDCSSSTSDHLAGGSTSDGDVAEATPTHR